MDPKYGLYPGKQRYHVDQVPLEFSQTRKRSYNDKNKGECWIVGSKIDMEKRQATLQLCFCAEAPQNVKPALIVRGKPKTLKDGTVDSTKPHCNSTALEEP